jgi:ABC-type nitrate/sulfonate/bicarbonate transport system permease component
MRRYAWIPLLALLLLAWEGWVRLRGIPDYLLPAPTDVARALWHNRSDLAAQALVTLREMVLGLLLAVAAGLSAAIVLQRLDWLRAAVYPLLIASQSVPLISLSPLLLIYLGFGLTPHVVIVALVCFFPVTANALDGFRRTPADLRRMMRTLNASPRAIFWRVELPWALPRVFTGIKIATAYAAVGAVFSEYAGGSGGLADSMREQLDTPLVGAAITLLALLSLALVGLVALLERAAVPWADEE